MTRGEGRQGIGARLTGCNNKENDAPMGISSIEQRKRTRSRKWRRYHLTGVIQPSPLASEEILVRGDEGGGSGSGGKE